MARDAIKLALPGVRYLVEVWGLPTRLGWSLDPDRGSRGAWSQIWPPSPEQYAWPAGVCMGEGCRNKSPRVLCTPVPGHAAGGQSPGRVFRITT